MLKKSVKQYKADLSEHLTADGSQLIEVTEAEITGLAQSLDNYFRRSHGAFFRRGEILVGRTDVPTSATHDHARCLYLLGRATHGDLAAQHTYEACRPIDFESLPRWLQDGTRIHTTTRLHDVRWSTLSYYFDDPGPAKTLTSLYEEAKIDPLAALGIKTSSTYWEHIKFLEVCELKAENQNEFTEWFDLAVTKNRVSISIALKKGTPNFGLQSIYHPGDRPIRLREISTKVANFILAGVIVEDFCEMWNLSCTEEQKLALTKSCWASPWEQADVHVFSKFQKILAFIDSWKAYFRSERECSEFLIEAMGTSSLTTLLDEKALNLGRRKSSRNRTALAFGQNESIKNLFSAAAQRICENPTEAEALKRFLLQEWRKASVAGCHEICRLAEVSTSADTLKLSWGCFQEKHATGPLRESIGKEPTQSAPTEISLDDFESEADQNDVELPGYHLIDTFNGERTPFFSTLDELSSRGQHEIVRKIRARLDSLRQRNTGDIKKLRASDLYELRIFAKNQLGVRVYLTKVDQNTWCLLDIGEKTRENDQQQANDIARLSKFWQSLKDSTTRAVKT